MKFKRLGSNQYKTKWATGKKKTFLEWHWFLRFIVVMVLTWLIIALVCVAKEWYDKLPVDPIVSPVIAQEPITVRFVECKKTSEMQIIRMITDEFEEFGPQVVFKALRIANCESKFDEKAEHLNRNGTWDLGIFQINDIQGFGKFERLAAWENINIAKKIFIKSGYNFSAWVCK